jgi:NADH:ubiquinone oxidoreductase subunit K
MIKLLFHFLNIIFILFYVYPGSILGYVIYSDFNRQPYLTSDFVVSSNHVYAFLLLSILGLFSYFKSQKKIILYLFSISIILELLHLVIPNRSFQFYDLFGNIFGVLISLFLLILVNFWRKK